jgi:hypothetical protein
VADRCAARPRTRLLLSVLLGGLFAGVTAVTNPAAAAVPGLQTVSAFSANDSSTSKTATAICPAPKVVIGTGADVIGAGPSEVVIERFTPAGNNAVRVAAYEDDTGYPLSWVVRAWAICANPLPGRQIVSLSSATNSVSPKSVTATCPAGKQLVGTGGSVSGGTGQVRMNTISPTSTGALVQAYEDETGLATNWTLVAVAICANPLPGHQIVTAAGPNNSSPPSQTLSAACPLGKSVLGVGAGVTAPAAVLGQIGLTALTPSPGSGTVTVKAAEDQTGLASNWAIVAAAICATA